jgi:hypothetical protein
MSNVKSKKKSVNVGDRNGSANGATVEINLDTKAGLKQALLKIKERMADESAAPIFTLSVLNRIICDERIYQNLDQENRELAREIWISLKRSGLQIKTPTLLFAEDEALPVIV